MAKELFAALAFVCVLCSPSTHAASFVETAVEHIETGLASYYSSRFEGRRTASGATFRNDLLMAAHPTFPFGTVALVTNLMHGYSVIVHITDRGPTAPHQRRGVVIDLSQSAASQLKMMAAGRVPVSVRVLEWGKGSAGVTQPVMRYEPRTVQVHEREKVVLADSLEPQESR